MELINKSAVVAEIEKQGTIQPQLSWFTDNLIQIINSYLEVKEVDLDKEIQNHIKECLNVKFPTTDIDLIKKDVAYTAKKFFEFGLNMNNNAVIEKACNWLNKELYTRFNDNEYFVALSKEIILKEFIKNFKNYMLC